MPYNYKMTEREKRREAKLSREILKLTIKRSKIRLGLK